MIKISQLSHAALAVGLIAAMPAFAAAPVDAAAASAVAADAAGSDVSDIIVTGTRQTGFRAIDSAAPIQVLGADALAKVGQPNLIQALSQILPSFTAESLGGDTANLTLSARLRGLSPNQTLVLVNGKRRHPTANLHVLGGPYQGAASPDLDLISPASIERIEVLQDGAAAQYGSDAIAGVINIILKSDTGGGYLSGTAGSYYKGGGDTFAETGRVAVPLGDHGFFDLTVFHRFHGFSQQGGADRRLVDANGTPLPGRPAGWASIPGYPNLNAIVGDARSILTTGTYNAGYDFGDVEVYSFGTYGHRDAQARENYRLPNRVSRTVNGVTTLPFPNGFKPLEALNEDDYSFTGGVKGEAAGWHYDLSGTYGGDTNKISTLDSANASLYADTGVTPTNFYDGTFKSTQFTGNLDLSHEYDLGLAKPTNVAIGAEYRRETFEIGSGDPLSYYKEGAQSYPGFRPSDAGKYSRKAYAGYADIAVNPVEKWLVDLAGRYETYSDFGDTVIGKLTTRYDFSEGFALRGTVATGFRAPTLAEEYYSATNVSPTSAVVQLPANSKAAGILGFQKLKPEKSTNFSLGAVIRPTPQLTLTIDAYQIKVRSRVVGTGTLLGLNRGVVVSQKVIDAITANGNVLDPTVTFVGASVFANGADTRTRGIEAIASLPTDLSFGRINWTLSGNYNETKVTRNRLGTALFDASAVSYLETASPKYKVGLGALFTTGALAVNVRETLYGPSSLLASASGSAPFNVERIGVAAITDLEVSYKVLKGLDFALGANNLFSKRPPIRPITPGSASPTSAGTLSDGSNVLNAPYGFSPYGINGGYYYGRVSVTF